MVSKKHRKAISTLGLLGLVLATSSCATGNTAEEASDIPGCLDELPDDGKVPAGHAVKNSFEDTTLTFVGYGGSFQEAQSQAFLEPFAACTGAEVQETSPGDYAQLQSMVEHENVSWDVVYYGAQVVAEQCGVLAEELDPDKVDMSAVNLPEDYQLSDCQAPVDVEPSYLVYDEARFGDNPPTDMADFFDTETYPGKRLIYADPGASIPDFITAVALHLGYTHEEIQSDFPYDEVFDEIASLGSDLVTYTTFSESQQRLEAGDVAMGWVAAARAYEAQRNGAVYSPIWTEDTWGYVVADLYIPKGTENLDAAQALINYAMGSEQQSAVTEQVVYNPTHSEAEPQVPEDMEPYVGTPERMEGGFTVTTEYWLEHNSELVQRWSDFVTGQLGR